MSINPEFESILSKETATKIGTVGVLYGGLSDERQVSLWSGEAVFNALVDAGIDAELIDVKEDFLEKLMNRRFNWAFPVLHGRGGEDGKIQSILEWLNIPFVGSEASACAIAMNKMLTKQIWQSKGLPVLPQIELQKGFDSLDIIDRIGLPMAVKPALEGSSNGISKVKSKAELLPAFEKAQKHGSVTMAESWVEGREFTGAIIGDRVMPLIEICVDNDNFYDFETKYIKGASQYICPCELPEEREQYLQQLVLQASQAIGAQDWCRVDFMMDNNDQPWLIEINMIPGMTKTSLVPKAAYAGNGLSFTQTVVTILNQSTRKYYA